MPSANLHAEGVCSYQDAPWDTGVLLQALMQYG